jgi:pimeloyl-ACP methyl ester carboxylesterase
VDDDPPRTPSASAAQSGCVRANGVSFAYLSAGDGPLVLLLHGFPDTAHTWDGVMPALAAAGFRAVAPWMRGYHPSEIPADGRYDTDTLGRDVVALIEALGVDSAIVVGHDWGASAAYSAAALAPDRVRLLVAMAVPHPRSLRPSPRLVWAMRHFITLRSARAGERVRANDFAYVDELWRRWSPAWRELPASETAHVKAAFAQPGCAEAACAYYAAVGARLPSSHRPQIVVPTIAFAGEDDMIAPRAYERARRCFDGSYEVVIVAGGHFMHREHPQTFAAELVRAIGEHARRQG